MKKTILLFILLLVFIKLNAQDKTSVLIGKTVLDSLPTADVHVVNLHTNKGTITNAKGFFEIPVKVGDSLFFSHLNLQGKFLVISKQLLKDKNLIIHLEEKTVTLNGFILEKPKSIFYQDPQITEYNGPTVNAKTLNLPYANTKVKKDDAIFKFRSGGVVSLDNLINSINGNNKRKKLMQKMAKDDANLEKIRKLFTDDFFVTDLKIKKEYINQFLNDCVDKNIISIFKSDNIINLTNLLIKESKLYPHKMRDENLFLTKK